MKGSRFFTIPERSHMSQNWVQGSQIPMILTTTTAVSTENTSHLKKSRQKLAFKGGKPDHLPTIEILRGYVLLAKGFPYPEVLGSASQSLQKAGWPHTTGSPLCHSDSIQKCVCIKVHLCPHVCVWKCNRNCKSVCVCGCLYDYVLNMSL